MKEGPKKETQFHFDSEKPQKPLTFSSSNSMKATQPYGLLSNDQYERFMELFGGESYTDLFTKIGFPKP